MTEGGDRRQRRRLGAGGVHGGGESHHGIVPIHQAICSTMSAEPADAVAAAEAMTGNAAAAVE
nr:hypothetical protein [Nocardia acidivorans]